MTWTEPRVLDLCCGSGCIGLAVAHQLPGAHVTLADISRPALAVAKRNIKRLKLQNRVTAIGLDARKKGPSFVGALDALVCNPPYVTSEEMPQLAPSVRDYEPALALDGGADGLLFYRAVVDNFTHLIAAGGYPVLRIWARTAYGSLHAFAGSRVHGYCPAQGSARRGARGARQKEIKQTFDFYADL